MQIPPTNTKIKLHGFNNLTKSVCLCFYRLHYIDTPESQHLYNSMIAKQFDAEVLRSLLTQVSEKIGGNILNTACQNYQPQGASVTMMIAENETSNSIVQVRPDQQMVKSIVNHLDKSHLCIHTYPETQPVNGINIFRADIEISTCGIISPLKAADLLVEYFNAELVTIDYRVRGVTKDIDGGKHYIDEEITSITSHLSHDILHTYQSSDENLARNNNFSTRLKKREVELSDVLFNKNITSLSPIELNSLKAVITAEINDLYLMQ